MDERPRREGLVVELVWSCRAAECLHVSGLEDDNGRFWFVAPLVGYLLCKILE